MLALNLLSMFKRHCKLTICAKINIIQGFILKIRGYPPPPLGCQCMKITWLDEGLDSCVRFMVVKVFIYIILLLVYNMCYDPLLFPREVSGVPNSAVRCSLLALQLLSTVLFIVVDVVVVVVVMVVEVAISITLEKKNNFNAVSQLRQIMFYGKNHLNRSSLNPSVCT